MTRAVRVIHTYAALLTLVNLAVYVVTGTYAALHLQRAGAPVVRYQAYVPVDGESPRKTAERLAAQLGLTLATPVQSAAIQHNRAGELLLDFYHANGRDQVTVLPAQRQLRIESTRNSLARYLDILHMTTGVFRSGDRRMQFWAYENEFALWCFVSMLGSAVWMVAARFRALASTRVRAMHLAAAGLFFPFACILAVSALQMAHRSWFGPVVWASKLHRNSTIVAAVAALCIPILAITGLALCFRIRRAVFAAGLAAAVTLVLIGWMRQ